MSRLKSDQKLIHFAPALGKVRSGADGFRVQAIRDLIDRLDNDERAESFIIAEAAALAGRAGVEAVRELPCLGAASYAHRALKISGELDDQDGRERALCAARFMASADWDIKPAREFYAAGIPVETAAAVYQSGGGPQQTAAVRGDAITAPLAGWYL